MALVTIIFILFLISILVLGYVLIYKIEQKLLWSGIIFIIVFLGLLSLMLYYNIHSFELDKESSKLADFGSYTGGTIGTLVAVFAVFAAGFAFYAQYEANRQVQNQFKIQQFESRLYKMLDIYNVNVNNLKFITRKRGKIFEGKMVFPSLISNFNQLRKDIKIFLKDEKILINDLITEKYKNELIKLNIYGENFIALELSYIIFLYGVGANGRKNIKALLNEKYELNYLSQILNYLSHKPIFYDPNHQDLIDNWENILVNGTDFSTPNNQKFDKYYNGHQNNLSHYYRHLFMIIRYIDSQFFLDYEKKWEYVKLIRTQLSNHEQELFFINSITSLGREWELNYLDENRRFITKYDLIKNISKAIRDKYNIEDFYPSVVYEDVAKNSIKRDYNEKSIYK